MHIADPLCVYLCLHLSPFGSPLVSVPPKKLNPLHPLPLPLNSPSPPLFSLLSHNTVDSYIPLRGYRVGEIGWLPSITPSSTPSLCQLPTPPPPPSLLFASPLSSDFQFPYLLAEISDALGAIPKWCLSLSSTFAFSIGVGPPSVSGSSICSLLPQVLNLELGDGIEMYPMA